MASNSRLARASDPDHEQSHFSTVLSPSGAAPPIARSESLVDQIALLNALAEPPGPASRARRFTGPIGENPRPDYPRSMMSRRRTVAVVVVVAAALALGWTSSRVWGPAVFGSERPSIGIDHGFVSDDSAVVQRGPSLVRSFVGDRPSQSARAAGRPWFRRHRSRRLLDTTAYRPSLGASAASPISRHRRAPRASVESALLAAPHTLCASRTRE